MTDYERALTAARQTSVIVPEFEVIAAASDRDRESWTDEDHGARTRARRWLLFAAAIWPSLILLVALDTPWPDVLLGNLFLLLPAFGLVWAARLSRDRRIRSAILTRAMAALSLVLALLVSLAGVDSWCLVSVVLAVASGRSLQLLGERDLDGSDDPDSSFEPVKFRGILILALVMACTDALTLLAAATLTGAFLTWAYLFGDYHEWKFALPMIGWTMPAIVLTSINVWGLLRLRTWALFTSMLTNVGIAVLALSGMLATGGSVTVVLVTTAGVQLLLPLPILATALGWDGAPRYGRIWPVLLRVAVPAIVLATIVSATIHFAM